MLDLKTCDYNDVAHFARSLYDYHMNNSFSFEAVAQSCTEEIYSAFTNPEGQPTFALVRIFRYGHYDDLLPELQQLVSDDTDHCLALMGTTGTEREWCHRTLSRSRQIVSPQTASLMFQEAFKSIGFDWTASSKNASLQTNEQEWGMRTFYVPQASGSEVITDQENFVRPYGIESVVGVGGQLAGDAGVIILAFATEPLSEHDIDKFSELTPYVLTALANYNHPDTLWR